eukprot:TRINITY_DN67591_c0_g1_i3.p1 TRINITY_DN67591_c0_g1~~TRINITY_DN67591_c0_g1_i3.p1  ORF type:complete len:379 (+),score=52.60 TRINITY_DN67591_c0_g1_i3:215-1351(+)
MDLSSYGVRIYEEQGKGRGLVAARHFAPGEVALVSEAWISCICPSQAATCCARCLRRGELTPCCKGCGFAYCSDACREADEPDHKVECAALPGLRRRLQEAGDNVWHNGDALLNVLLLARSVRAQAAPTSGPAKLASPFKDKPHALRAIMSTPRLSIPLAIAEATLAAAAEQPGLLPQQRRSNREEQLVMMIALLLQQQVNACGVLEPQRFEVTGEGLFIEGALVNHSCESNCQFLYRWDTPGGRPTQYLMVMKPIGPGEELTISYGDVARPVWERRKRFQRSHWFTCRCSRCEREVQPAGLQSLGPLIGDSKGRVLLCLLEASAGEEAANVLKALQTAGLQFAPDVDSRRVKEIRSYATNGLSGNVNAFRLEGWNAT